MKILAVLCQNPFAIFDGGTYAMRASLRRLAHKGDLQVAGWGPDFEQDCVGPYRSAGSLGPAYNSPMRFLASVLAGRSYSIDKYAHPSARQAFQRIVEDGEFGIIWYEKLQSAAVALQSALLGRTPGPVHVLRAHNVEHSMFLDRFDTSAWPQGYLLAREARALKIAELDLISKVDLVLNLTREDRDQLAQERPEFAKKLVLLPVLAEDMVRQRDWRIRDRNAALFVGDCRWRPNLLAAEWVTNQLAPELLRVQPEVVIRLAGHGTETFRNRMPNVEAVGFVEHIEDEYDQAVCTLAPIWHGGGINIKVIASLAHGVPVIGSAFARRGILSEAYLEAETPSQFIAGIGQLVKDPKRAERLGRAGQRGMEESEKYFDEFWIQYFG